MSEPKDAAEPFVLTIDFDSLTLGEIDEIETRLEMSIADVGQSLATVGQGGMRMGKVLRTFALVKMRRLNPDATWEDTANVRPPQAQPPVNPLRPPSEPNA